MSELRNGMAVRYEGEPCLVTECHHKHFGRGGASVTARLKNLRTGSVREVTLRESDDLKELHVERHEGTYSYNRGDSHVFYDSETYEEVTFTTHQLSEQRGYLTQGQEVRLLVVDGVPLAVELPAAVSLKVVETVPGVKGDTQSGGSKPAVTQTGLVVQAPLFIVTGDTIRVDTRSGEYLERE